MPSLSHQLWTLFEKIFNIGTCNKLLTFAAMMSLFQSSLLATLPGLLNSIGLFNTGYPEWNKDILIIIIILILVHVYVCTLYNIYLNNLSLWRSNNYWSIFNLNLNQPALKRRWWFEKQSLKFVQHWFQVSHVFR